MPARLSKEERERFLAGRHVAVLVTIGEDGAPVPGPIWYRYRDGAFYFRTADDAVRTKNIRRDPRVSICVQDERPPYKAIVAYGRATIEPAEQGLAEELPRHYLGMIGAIGYKQAAARAIEQGPEVTLVVRPDRITSFDFTPETPAYGRAWLTLKRILPPWL
jgi:PPOX class probable F420-dependent enzyme